MKPGLTITVDTVAKALEGIAYLANHQVLVGIPAEKGARKDGDPINNATLGYLHENGVPEKNIPARPWLFPAVREHKDQIATMLKKVGEAALSGGEATAEKGLHALGLTAQSFVKKKLHDGPFEPLSPRTLAARRARGVTREKPLLDTLQMLNSVTYVIRKAE